GRSTPTPRRADSSGAPFARHYADSGPDREEASAMAETEGGVGGIGRRIVAPVRAVTRIFTPVSGDSSSAGKTRDTNSECVIDCAVYVDGVRLPGEWTYRDALAAARKHDHAFVWLGLHEPGADDIEDIANVFQLDEFAVEDAVKGGQRPKIESYGTMSFLVMRTTRYIEHTELTETSEIVETGDLMLFIGPDYVITVRHGDLSALGPVRTELESSP